MRELHIGILNISSPHRYLDVLIGCGKFLYFIYSCFICTYFTYTHTPFTYLENKPESRSQSSGTQCPVGTINPQASEDATQGLWSVYFSVTAYILYAIFKDYTESRAEVPRPDVSPQSEEVSMHLDTETISMEAGTTVEQNVQFVDTNPGYTLAEKATFDPVRDQALLSDASLEEFFARPIKITSFDWIIGGASLHEVFNPWKLYFENPRVINRLANYKLMRSKLHVKVTISGTQFHYGRALMSYNPFPDLDNLTVDRVVIDADLVAATQRPHILLDPTVSQGGDLVLPFFYYKNVIDITTSDWGDLGEMLLVQMNELKHANGGTDPITINVFAWAEDIKFAIPTNLLPDTFVVQAQADEYGKGPISRIAGIVSSAAGKLSMIPPIAPFARATEIGATAVGALATLFGYSRPVDLTHSQFRPNTKSSLAITNMCDDTQKLTLDSRQELSIDPRTAGLGDVDELGINYIASRQSYFTQFTWPVGGVTESLLYNVVVEPGLWRSNNSELHLPAMSYAALPFKYWRGSLKYRFQVVCSTFHKGRIKIVYDPSGTAGANAEYNTAYTTVVDIADTTDFEITVGWGQATTYRQTLPIASLVETVFSDTSVLAYSSSTAVYGNGTIAVYVVNELTVPNTTVNNDIQINMYVSAGDDFEVAQADDTRIARIRLTNATNVVNPQSEEISPQAEEMDRLDSKPHVAPTLNKMGAQTTLSDQTNHIHFGENVRSFRQLLKRYAVHEYISASKGTANDKQILQILRPAMPYEPGYTATAGSLTFTLLANEYTYGYMTPLRYLSCAFGGWKGGVRYMYDLSQLNLDTIRRNGTVVVGNNLEELVNIPTDSATLLGNSANAIGRQLLQVANQRTSGVNGITMQASEVNPTVCFEVPYYSEYRFTPAKQRIDFGAVMFNQPYSAATVTHEVGTGEEFITTYCSAAEDFTCFMYLGPPIFYYEGTPPTV
jgi:hypothetical protein